MISEFKSFILGVGLVSIAAAANAQGGFSDHYSFMKAVRDRDGETVTSLISAPGSVVINAKDRSTGDGALHIVVRDRDYKWLSFLLGRGARVDAQNDDGLTPLALAAQLGWNEGAQLLLERGAGVDLANRRGETPLIFAVQARSPAMVRLLMSKGANPKKTDSVTGYSALDHAKRDSRSAAIVKILEESVGADPVIGPSL